MGRKEGGCPGGQTGSLLFACCRLGSAQFLGIFSGAFVLFSVGAIWLGGCRQRWVALLSLRAPACWVLGVRGSEETLTVLLMQF